VSSDRRHALSGQRRLSRRHFLGGAAVCLGLPWLPSLGPARASGIAPPLRNVFWFVPNGVNMDAWRIDGFGDLADLVLPPTLAPLTAHQQSLLVLTGLDNLAAVVDIAGDHARGTGSFLTCTTVNHSESDVVNGVSIDQLIAEHLAGQTSRSSLQLGIEGGDGVGDCDSGYSCSYVHNISWSGASTPLPQITDPALVFDLLFGGDDPDASDEDKARRQHYRLSVLDTVLDEIHALQPQLSSTDNAKLDEYLTGVRELEGRIAEGTSLVCTPPERPQDPDGVPQATQAMVQLMATALECDATRVISFMQGNGGSGLAHDHLGISSSHHDLSHHLDDPDNLAKLATIDAWEVSQLALFLDELAARTDVSGESLLDHTLVMFSSELSDGDGHDHTDLPVLLAGGGSGTVRPGRHVDVGNTPIADLYITLAAAQGLALPTFGLDGSRVLTELS